MRDLLNDLRYGWRHLRRTPSFTAVAVLTLALGIGANTLFFAVVDATIWRPLRSAHLENTYAIETYKAPRPPVPGAPRTFESAWYALTPAQLAHLQSNPALGVVATTTVGYAQVTAQTPQDADHLRMEIVRGDYAAVYDLQPLAGQLPGLRGESALAGPVVVISERLWRRWFKSDLAIIGERDLRLNGRRFTIAGVLPTRASFTDVWIAAESWRTAADPPAALDRLSQSFVRLRPASARARLLPLVDVALASGPTPPAEGYKAVISPAASRIGLTVVQSLRVTWIVVGLSSLVLLAACANLANMLYARAAQRAGEIAVRLALGSGAWRVFRLFLLEATLLAGLAASLGLVAALSAMRWITTLFPGATFDRYARVDVDLSADWRVIAYAFGIGVASAVAVGSLTAWRASRTPPLRVFAASGVTATTTSRGKWTRTALVAVQVSAAVILLLGTGLFLIRAFEEATTSVLFDGSHLATAQLELAPGRFNDTQVAEKLAQVLASVERVPQIDAAAITDGFFGGAYSRAKSLKNLVAEDESQIGKLSAWRLLTGSQAAVSPRFLETLGLALLSGRNFTPNDRDGAPEVVLLSDSAAKSLWPEQSPLGKRVRLASDPRWYTVIGIFQDPMANTADTPWVCGACVALTSWTQMTYATAARAQRPERDWLLVVRAASPDTVADQLRHTVGVVDPNIPVFQASAARASILAGTNAQAAFGGLIGSLGLLSMAIAALGVYGVISYSVSRRTREFGIRLALGATPRTLVRTVLDEAVHLVLVGLLPGVLLASWATRVLEVSIVRLMPNDISTWVVVPCLVLAIGVVAAWIPARRAGRVDPNVALRDL